MKNTSQYNIIVLHKHCCILYTFIFVFFSLQNPGREGQYRLYLHVYTAHAHVIFSFRPVACCCRTLAGTRITTQVKTGFFWGRVSPLFLLIYLGVLYTYTYIEDSYFAHTPYVRSHYLHAFTITTNFDKFYGPAKTLYTATVAKHTVLVDDCILQWRQW